MTTKRIVHYSVLTGLFAIALAVSLVGSNNNPIFVRELNAEAITISTDTVEDFQTDDSFYMTTPSGNKIKFECSGVTKNGDKLSFAAGGYILNPFTNDLYNNAISGMYSLKITHNGNTGVLRVDYTWGGSLNDTSPYYQRRNYTFPATSSFGFLSEEPNYLKISANTAVEVDSIELSYSCQRGAEKGDNLQIGSAEMFERLKTVVNWGNTFEGQTVELSDDIDMSEKTTSTIGVTGNPFKGTFDGKNHTVSNLTISGSTQIAPFGNVEGGTIKNVSFSNISMTASSQRAAGVAARTVDATIDNCHVLSGSLQGTGQNGGIVGVNVAGTGKTQISNCSNAASVTGTSGGGNGGIAGYIHSGNVVVYDCINNGNITSTGTNTTGGIVGSIDATQSTLEINLCELGKTTIVTNDNAATAARATCGYIIGSGNATVVKVVGSGRITDIISTVAEYDQFVTACSTSPYYRYQVAKLTVDLDFENTDHGIATFYGMLDGGGHTINGFKKSGASQIALLGNCAYGGVKNLKLSNIDITATTQRAAGIAGRSEDASYKNIEILSGTITGKTLSGGIAGVVVTSTTRMLNCINRATVEGESSSLGGLVGSVTSTNASIVINNCKNYGNVTSSSAGYVGGFIGSISDITSPNVCSITNSINEGNVSSTSAGKAGFIGYFLKLGSATNIDILNCENKGSVSGNGEYTAGIFGGWGPGSSNIPADPSYILTFTIKNTKNSGSISGTGNGCGGIVGATNNVESYLIIKIIDCENTGAISGVGYVGGISGLIRNTLTTNQSIIEGCKNFGDVTSTGTGCGGICGTARINVVNCGCYSEATLKAGSTTKLAKNANEIGTPGYIALNYESGCPTHTGNHLINLDGSNYST